MKNIILFLIAYLTHEIICQNNIYGNNRGANYQINTNYSNINKEMPDNPLVFNALFSDLKEQWSKKMADFVSQYIYLIPVPYKTQVDFYENITKVPCQMKGAFLLEEANSKRDVVDFKIIAPNKTVIFQSSSIGSIFSLNLTDKGLYTILFNNRILNKEIKPTLIMNSGQNLFLEKENLSETEKKMDLLLSFLKRYEQDYKLNRGFRKRGEEQLSDTNKYFFIFSFVETIVLIGVSCWQYYYLKHLFEVKGSL
jgi:hypothetical protein